MIHRALRGKKRKSCGGVCVDKKRFWFWCVLRVREGARVSSVKAEGINKKKKFCCGGVLCGVETHTYVLSDPTSTKETEKCDIPK